MSVHGSLSTISLEDVLEWVDRRYLCGVLTIRRSASKDGPALERSFRFDSGYITGATSNDPDEYLGRLLVSRGVVAPGRLEEAYAAQGDTGILLGKILLMTGAVTEAQLQEALEHKIFDSVCDGFLWSEGEFSFEPSMGEAVAYEVSVNLRSVIDAGCRRAQDWSELRLLIASADSVFDVLDSRKLHRRGDSPKQRETHTQFLRHVKENLTVSQMVGEHGGRRFHVYSCLGELIERGVIAVRDGHATLDGEHAARALAAEGQRALALEAAEKALLVDPANASLQKLQRELERSVFAELSRELLKSFRVPRLLVSPKEVASLELDDNERYLAGRVDGRWDLLSLMRISPLREAQALITLKRLADRGIISL